MAPFRDVEADGWERSEFPIICESCLGDNPYVRMVCVGVDFSLRWWVGEFVCL